MRVDTEILDKKQLTSREADVLKLVCNGLPDKLIARALGISIKPVSTHIDHIYEKLGIRWASINTRCTAISLAVASGMVKIGLHLVFAVLIFNTCLLNDDVVTRTRVRSARVMRVRRERLI